MEYWNFSQSLDFHKGHLICGRLPKSEFSRFLWTGPTGAGASSQVLQAPLPILRSVCLLPGVQMALTALGSLGVWCWIPQRPQRHFCSRMDAKFLLLRWGTSKECLVLLWCWCHSPYAFAFIEVLISSHSFKLLSNVILFHPEGLCWALLAEWV